MLRRLYTQNHAMAVQRAEEFVSVALAGYYLLILERWADIHQEELQTVNASFRGIVRSTSWDDTTPEDPTPTPRMRARRATLDSRGEAMGGPSRHHHLSPPISHPHGAPCKSQRGSVDSASTVATSSVVSAGTGAGGVLVTTGGGWTLDRSIRDFSRRGLISLLYEQEISAIVEECATQLRGEVWLLSRRTALALCRDTLRRLMRAYVAELQLRWVRFWNVHRSMKQKSSDNAGDTAAAVPVRAQSHG